MLFCGVALAQETVLVDRIVAVVNDELVTLYELNQKFEPYLKNIKSLGYSAEKERKMLFKLRSDLLDQVNLFDALDSEDRLNLENHATDITVLAADTIVGESERGDNFYILIHGTAAVLKLNEDGSSQQITEFNDGDVIGESSLLEQEKGRHRRSATIVARTACNLVSINRKVMLGIVEKYPDIRQQLQRIHDERIDGVEQPEWIMFGGNILENVVGCEKDTYQQ